MKMTIFLFSFLTNKGNVDNATYLNVYSSIFSVLQELNIDGYNVEGLQDTSEALIKDKIHAKEVKFNIPNINIAYKMNVRKHQQLTP